MLEKILEEMSHDSGMFELKNVTELFSRLQKQQYVDTSFNVSAQNRGTPGNKCEGFGLDSGLKMSAKLLRARYPDLKPTKLERLAGMLFHTYEDQMYLANDAWDKIQVINVLWKLPAALIHYSIASFAAVFIAVGRRVSKGFANIINQEETRAQKEAQVRAEERALALKEMLEQEGTSAKPEKKHDSLASKLYDYTYKRIKKLQTDKVQASDKKFKKSTGPIRKTFSGGVAIESLVEHSVFQKTSATQDPAHRPSIANANPLYYGDEQMLTDEETVGGWNIVTDRIVTLLRPKGLF